MISSKRWALRFSFVVWLGATACATLPVSLARAVEPSGSAALTKATQLAAKAAQLRDERKWDEAIPIAEEVVRLRDANAPATAVSRADAYTALVYILRGSRQRERAVAVAQKAVAARELSEPGSQHLASDLLTLAWTLEENGDHASAEAPQRRALALFEASPTPDVDQLLRAAEGVVGFEMDRFGTSADTARLVEAEAIARRAIRVAERAPDASLERARAQILLGQVLVRKGDERCEDILRRASNALEARKDADAVQARAGALGALGSYLVAKRRFRDGAAIFRQALAVSAASLGATHPHSIVIADSLASALNQAGDYAEALTVAEAALLRARPNTGYYRCDIGLERDIGLRQTVANAKSSSGDYRGALAVVEAGLVFVENGYACTIIRGLPGVAGSSSSSSSKRVDNVKEHPLALVGSLTALGAIQTQMLLQGIPTDASVAEARFRKAIGVAEASGPGAAASLAAARGDLALLLWKVGRLDEAETLMRKALESMPQASQNLGLILQDRGKLDEAERIYRAAVESADTQGDDPSYALECLALLLLQRGRVEESRTANERLDTILDRQLERAVLGGSDAQRRMLMSRVARLGRTSTTLHLQALPNDTTAARAALRSILRRKGRALDAGHSAIDALRGRASPADKEALDDVAQARRRLADAAIAGQPEAKLEPLERYVRRLEAELGKKYAAMRAEGEPVEVEAVRARLRPDQVLVELVAYYPFERGAWSSPHYGAYVLKADGTVLARDLGDAAKLDSRIRAARRSLASGAADATERLRELDELLFRPLRPLVGSSREILVAPEGNVALVPMGALVDESGRYAVERYRFTVLSSGRDLLREKGTTAALTAPVVMGAPDFDLALAATAEKAEAGTVLSRAHFEPLPGTEREVAQIAALAPGALRLTSRDATKQAMLGVRSPRFLHVATHGFFLASEEKPSGNQRGLELVGGSMVIGDPLVRSGLAFAGANRTAGASILSALEASNLDLRGTQLVVLSACETGVGEVEPGEGVLGLRRALVLAGAQSQVMSLWKVSDDATASLMVHYYRRTLAGAGRSEAMRDAQLTLASSPATRHPYYWAAFVVSGDDATLEGAAPGAVREVFIEKGHGLAVPRVVKPQGGCGCDAVGTGGRGDGPWAVVVLGVVVAGLRRRRRRFGG